MNETDPRSGWPTCSNCPPSGGSPRQPRPAPQALVRSLQHAGRQRADRLPGEVTNFLRTLENALSTDGQQALDSPGPNRDPPFTSATTAPPTAWTSAISSGDDVAVAAKVRAPADRPHRRRHRPWSATRPDKRPAATVFLEAQIAVNVAGIRKTFEKFLRFGKGPTDAVMVNNCRMLRSHMTDFLPSISALQRQSHALIRQRAPALGTRAAAELPGIQRGAAQATDSSWSLIGGCPVRCRWAVPTNGQRRRLASRSAGSKGGKFLASPPSACRATRAGAHLRRGGVAERRAPVPYDYSADVAQHRRR